MKSGGKNLENGYGKKELELGIVYDGQNGKSWRVARDAGAVGKEGMERSVFPSPL